MEKKNKYTPYILVTVVYAIVTMFVIGNEQIDMGIRFMIAFIWAIVMFYTKILSGE